MQNNRKIHKEPFVYITKRGELPKSKQMLIKSMVILAGVIFCAILTILLTKEMFIHDLQSNHQKHMNHHVHHHSCESVKRS